MMHLRSTITSGTFGAVAAGAIALATASPAMADDHRYRDRDRGIGAEEVIAGAVILGGIAAIAGAFDNDRDDWDRDRRYRGRWDRDRRYRGNDRGFNRIAVERAIERCVRVAERRAQRRGGYRFADVTQIRDVDRKRYGLKIKGRLEVQGGRGYRGRDFDRGRFTCRIGRGGRPEIDFDGIRGLR